MTSYKLHMQLSAARDPPDQPTDELRLFVGGRELTSDSALVSEVGLGHGHVMHASAGTRSVVHATAWRDYASRSERILGVPGVCLPGDCMGVLHEQDVPAAV